MTRKLATIFHFFINNRTDQPLNLTSAELRIKWVQWMAKNSTSTLRGQQWYDRYYGERAVRCFITDKPELLGLSSVLDETEFETIYLTLQPYF